MVKETLTISKHWHKPGIKISILHDSDSPRGCIKIETSLEDFLVAVSEELSHPIKTWTKKGLKSDLTEASKLALEKIKESSVDAL